MRSGLEIKVAQQLKAMGIEFSYEKTVVEYIKPPSRYKTDFDLGAFIVETKGRFLPSDRTKHLLIKKQHPHLDIRFVFSDSRQKLSKKSTTTYGQWCEKNGFKFADKVIPVEWFLPGSL